MKKGIKKVLKALLPSFIMRYRNKLWIKKKINEWVEKGSPIPPPDFVKQNVIANYQKKYKYKTLIETGTYKGDMIFAMKKSFSKLISIELGRELFEKAQKRFENDKHITIYQGDSGIVLHQIMKEIKEPVVFWLDGHYSGGITALGDKACPIFEELDAIFNNSNFKHVLLIDDARDFNGNGDYPTIEKLSQYVTSKNPDYQMELKDDIIRFTI